MFGCLFGILGILTYGAIFAPLAAICSLTGMILGVLGLSVSGFWVSFLGATLTGIAIMTSPSIWIGIGLVLSALAIPGPPAN